MENAQLDTDLEATEAGDRQHERELRLAVDTIPGLAWTALPDGSCDFLNQRWLEYTGLTLEEAKGWGWQAAVCPQDLDALLDVWRGLLASGKPGEAEARPRRFDGEYRWFLFRAVPIRDERGAIVRWYGTTTDIEALKRAEALFLVERKTLELIAGGASIAQVLENLCRTMDAGTPNTITTVLLMDPDGKRLWLIAGPRIPSGPTRHHFVADRPMRRFVQHSGIPDVVPMDISVVSSGRTGELSEVWQGQLASRFGPRPIEVRT